MPPGLEGERRWEGGGQLETADIFLEIKCGIRRIAHEPDANKK